MKQEGTIYLLHFDKPFHHARHYLGWTSNLKSRIDRHWEGHGSKLIRAAILAGISFTLVMTWEGTRQRERELKNRHNGPKLCPICKERGLADLGKAWQMQVQGYIQRNKERT